MSYDACRSPCVMSDFIIGHPQNQSCPGDHPSKPHTVSHSPHWCQNNHRSLTLTNHLSIRSKSWREVTSLTHMRVRTHTYSHKNTRTHTHTHTASAYPIRCAKESR